MYARSLSAESHARLCTLEAQSLPVSSDQPGLRIENKEPLAMTLSTSEVIRPDSGRREMD